MSTKKLEAIKRHKESVVYLYRCTHKSDVLFCTTMKNNEQVVATSKQKALVSRIRAERRTQNKRNVTFRLDKELVDSFASACEAEGVSMNTVIKYLVSDFLNEESK